VSPSPNGTAYSRHLTGRAGVSGRISTHFERRFWLFLAGLALGEDRAGLADSVHIGSPPSPASRAPASRTVASRTAATHDRVRADIIDTNVIDTNVIDTNGTVTRPDFATVRWLG
jgi:hypothetical protein